jgi:hypothetical protein
MIHTHHCEIHRNLKYEMSNSIWTPSPKDKAPQRPRECYAILIPSLQGLFALREFAAVVLWCPPVLQSNPQASHLGPIRSQWHAVKGNTICQLHMLSIGEKSKYIWLKREDHHTYFPWYILCCKMIIVWDTVIYKNIYFDFQCFPST